MAQVPVYKARDFQATVKPNIALPVPVDFSGLGDLGKTLITQGIRQQVAQGKQDAIEASAASNGGQVSKREVSFLFGQGDAAFNKQIDYLNISNKQLQLDQEIGLAFANNQNNPEALNEAITGINENIYEGLDASVVGPSRIYATKLTNRVMNQAIANQVEILTKRSVNASSLRFSNLVDVGNQEMQATGTISPETEGAIEANLQLLEEVHGMDMDVAAKRLEWAESLLTAEHIYRMNQSGDPEAYIASMASATGPLGAKSRVTRLKLTNALKEQLSLKKAATSARVKKSKTLLEATSIKLKSGGEIDNAQALRDVIESNNLDPSLEKARVDVIRDLALQNDYKAYVGMPNKELVEAEAILEGLVQGRRADPDDLSRLEAMRMEINKRKANVRIGNQLETQTAVTPESNVDNPAAREVDIERTEQKYQAPVSYYKAQERETLSRQYNAAPENRPTILDGMLQDIPIDRRQSVISDLSRTDPDMALALDLRSRPDENSQLASQLLFEGQQLEDSDQSENIANMIKTRMAPYLTFDRDGTASESYYRAAHNIYKSLSGGDLALRPDMADKAVKLLLGLNERNQTFRGLPVAPFEPGMSTNQMEAIWATTTFEMFQEMNGGASPVITLEDGTSLPLTFEQLTNARILRGANGQYALAVTHENENYFVSKDNANELFIFDYRNNAEILQERGQAMVDFFETNDLRRTPPGLGAVPQTLLEAQAPAEPQENNVPSTEQPDNSVIGELRSREQTNRTNKMIDKGPNITNLVGPNQEQVTIDLNSVEGREQLPGLLDQGFSKGKVKPPTADQSKVATFTSRMENSESIFQDLTNAGFDPSSFGSRVGNAVLSFPGGSLIVGEEVERQDQAERDFTNAVLRRESGAAISPKEFDNAGKQYFARAGDSPATLRQKALNRRIVIEGFKQEAGQAYDPELAKMAREVIAETFGMEAIVDPEHLKLLKSEPNQKMRDFFDEAYGQGAAEEILGKAKRSDEVPIAK